MWGEGLRRTEDGEVPSSGPVGSLLPSISEGGGLRNSCTSSVGGGKGVWGGDGPLAGGGEVPSSGPVVSVALVCVI